MSFQFLVRRLCVAVVVCAFAGLAAASPYKPEPGEHVLGKAKAPVTVVEYGSVGCPHCAHWDKEVFPDLETKYIDTGKVRFVYREMLTGHPALAAAGFLTLGCLPPDRYFPVMHQIYARQEAMFRNNDIRAQLLQIAKAEGLDEAAWQACVTNPDNVAALNERSDRNAELDMVEGTPTFVVNGVILEGDPTMETFDKAIAQARKRPRSRKR